jgi:hypothetical protein
MDHKSSHPQTSTCYKCAFAPTSQTYLSDKETTKLKNDIIGNMNAETRVVGGKDTPLKREPLNSNVKLFIYLKCSSFTRRNLFFFIIQIH